MRENNSIERLLCQEIRSDCNFKISIFLFNFELYHIATTNWFYSSPWDIFQDQLKELLERCQQRLTEMERKQHWCNNLVFHSEMQLCHDLINKQLQTVRLKMWMAMSGNIMCLTNYCTHYSPTDHFVFVPLTKAPSCEKWIGLAISLINWGWLNLECRISLQILFGFSDIQFYNCPFLVNMLFL